MRDDVLIILNEREPLKQQMATLLAEQLAGRNLSHERLKPSTDIAKIILERKPRILILDYLLGDEATALDILGQLEEQEEKDLIRTIIWTDEPSVSVAVTAMKLGAYDYIELGAAKDLERLLKSIDDNLVIAQDYGAKNRTKKLRQAEEKPIFEAAESRPTLTQAAAAASRSAQVVVLLGPPGCGRSALARYIHQNRRQAGSYLELEWENWLGRVEDIFGESSGLWHPRMLSSSATVMIEHAEFDTGQLLELAGLQRSNIWSESSGDGQPMLIIGTSEMDVAEAWKRLLSADVIRIPALHERPADFLPLLQRFTAHSKQLGPTNRFDISAELIEKLTSLSWPGNIAQLRHTLVDTLTTPIAKIRDQYASIETTVGTAPGKSSPKMSEDTELLFTYLLDMKARWETFSLPSQNIPTALIAKRVLDESGGSQRLAAIKLGIGIPQLYAALRPDHTSREGSMRTPLSAERSAA